MLHFYGLTSQEDHIQQVVQWLKTKNITVETKYSDLSDDAKQIMTQHNFTVQPVLFHIDNGGNVTKFAEGGDIMNMTDDQVANVIKLVEADPK
jgi:hypothetical protein